MTTELTHTRLETILDREFELQKKVIRLVGTTSPLTLAFFFSQTYSKHINDLPHVVVFPDEKGCRIFQQCLEVFNPQKSSWVLPSFDVSPFSGLYPNSKVISERLNFLFHAQNAKPGELFLVTPEGLSQRTLPYTVFCQKFSYLRVNDLIPDNFSGLLQSLGYSSAPMVEDVGQFAVRGGIIDIFSPAHSEPVRIELFGDQIESLRHFNISEQRSTDEIKDFHIIPAREVLFTDENYEDLIARVRKNLSSRSIGKDDSDELIRALVLKNFYPGVEFLLPYFYPQLDSALDYFSTPLRVWSCDPPEISRQQDDVVALLKKDFETSQSILIRPEMDLLYTPLEKLHWPDDSTQISVSNLEFLEEENSDAVTLSYRTSGLNDFQNLANSTPIGTDAWTVSVKNRLEKWRTDGYRIFVGVKNPLLQSRLQMLLEKMGLTLGFKNKIEI
jgi:transcription-repair coupling factor (superfamily II helicase)